MTHTAQACGRCARREHHGGGERRHERSDEDGGCEGRRDEQHGSEQAEPSPGDPEQQALDGQEAADLETGRPTGPGQGERGAASRGDDPDGGEQQQPEPRDGPGGEQGDDSRRRGDVTLDRVEGPGEPPRRA